MPGEDLSGPSRRRSSSGPSSLRRLLSKVRVSSKSAHTRTPSDPTAAHVPPSHPANLPLHPHPRPYISWPEFYAERDAISRLRDQLSAHHAHLTSLLTTTAALAEQLALFHPGHAPPATATLRATHAGLASVTGPRFRDSVTAPLNALLARFERVDALGRARAEVQDEAARYEASASDAVAAGGADDERAAARLREAVNEYCELEKEAGDDVAVLRAHFVFGRAAGGVGEADEQGVSAVKRAVDAWEEIRRDVDMERGTVAVRAREMMEATDETADEKEEERSAVNMTATWEVGESTDDESNPPVPVPESPVSSILTLDDWFVEPDLALVGLEGNVDQAEADDAAAEDADDQNTGGETDSTDSHVVFERHGGAMDDLRVARERAKDGLLNLVTVKF